MNHTGRQTSHFLLLLMILLLPMPWHRVLFKQDFAGLYQELTSFSFYLSDIATLPFLASAISWLDWRRRRPLPLRSLTYPLGLLWLWTAFSSLWAFDLLLAWQMILRMLILLNICWLILRLKPNRKLVQLGLASSLLIQAVIAIAQFWQQDDLGLRWLGEPELAAAPGGISILSVADHYWLRAYGLTPHPNILGGVIAVSMLTLTAAYLQSNPRLRPAWLLLLLAGTVALFLSFSRAAWLGGLVGAAFFLLGIGVSTPWRRNYIRPLVALLISAGLLMVLLAWQQRPLLLARFTPGSSQLEARSLDERALLNQAGKRVARNNLLLGVGAHNSTVAIFPYVVANSNFTPQPIHNMLLLLTVELGLFGAGLWLWLMLLPLAISLMRLRRGQLSLWALALTSSLLAYAVIDMFDHYAWSWAQGQLLRWIFWGLWGAAVSRPTPNQSVA